MADDIEVRGNEVGEVALEERRILVCKEESGDVVFEGEGVGVPESAVGDAPASTFSAFIVDVAGNKARIGFLVVEGGCARRISSEVRQCTSVWRVRKLSWRFQWPLAAERVSAWVVW